MVGFSKPDTIYLLCNFVALSLSKLHFLEKQRLGRGDHICPLAFSQETGQVFLAIISGGQEVEVPWKSFCWNPLPVITSPVSSLGSEAAVREELCPFCLGSLETVSCLLSESVPSCCMRKDGGTSQPLMGFSSLSAWRQLIKWYFCPPTLQLEKPFLPGNMPLGPCLCCQPCHCHHPFHPLLWVWLPISLA